MYRCESWTIKKADHWRTDAFLKEISPEYSFEGLMLKLKLQNLGTWCEELTHLKRPWCWERLKTGGEGDDREWDGRMASLTQWTWVWVNSGSWWYTGRPGMPQSMELQRVGHDWVTELNWYYGKPTEVPLNFYTFVPQKFREFQTNGSVILRFQKRKCNFFLFKDLRNIL